MNKPTPADNLIIKDCALAKVPCGGCREGQADMVIGQKGGGSAVVYLCASCLREIWSTLADMLLRGEIRMERNSN